MSNSKPRNTNLDALVPISVRVEPDVYDYYAKEARKRRMSMTTYLRMLLNQGMINSKIEEFEERTEQMLHDFEQGVSAAMQQAGFTPSTLHSIALTEVMLKEIVSKLPEEKQQQMQKKATDLVKQFYAQPL